MRSNQEAEECAESVFSHHEIPSEEQDETESLSGTASSNGMSASLHTRGPQTQRQSSTSNVSQNAVPQTGARRTQQARNAKPQQRPSSGSVSRPAQKPRSGNNSMTASRSSTRQQDDEAVEADIPRKPSNPSSRNPPPIAARQASSTESISYAQAVKTPPRTSSVPQPTKALNPARQARNAPRKIEIRGPREIEDMELDEYEDKLQAAKKRLEENRLAAKRDAADRAAAADAQRRYMERLSTPKNRGHSARSSVDNTELESLKVHAHLET